MAWLILIIAGLLEVVWSLGLKYTHGFTRVVPSAITVVALIASVILLERAARVIPIGTAYAVWVGIGAFGAVLLEAGIYGVPLSVPRLLFLALLLFAIGGLKATA